jgi:hypothetical protein
MATQYTSILKLALPVQGELSGTWGNVINDNITSMVEEAVAGRAVIDSWTTNSHTLTTANGTASESRCAMLQFTDTGVALTGAATVICPSETKLYICKNSTGQQVTVKTAAGTGVALVDGVTKFVFCDGTNVEECVTSIETLKTDTINEATAAAGVTVDGVLLKDGGAVFADGATIEVDTINEATAAAGVTADGVLLKDGGITATAASSFSDSSGVALTVTGSGQELGLVSQASDTATVGPFFDIDRDSATPAVDDHIGSVGFTGRNSTAGTVRYSDVRGWIVDPTSTTESGGLRFLTYDAGTYATRAVVMGSDFGIGTTSPTAKLHVTNTGSGDSLLVEDSASPDSTPFVITSNGTVGLGTTAPSISNGVGPIIVSEASAAYGPQSSWRNTTSDATAGYFHFEKSRSGGLVSASDEVGTLSWRAHDGVDFRGVAGIGALMGATPAAGDTPGILYGEDAHRQRWSRWYRHLGP